MGTTSRPPKWIKPQLTRLLDEAPTGKDWLHEIKYDGYRMHAPACVQHRTRSVQMTNGFYLRLLGLGHKGS